MSAAEWFRLELQALVARGLGASGIGARVGLAAASEVWGGDAPRDRPAWYLWLRDVPGAYQLELAGAAPLAGAGGAAVLGRFTVRHFPSPADPALTDYSREERALVATALDATGTPRIDRAGAIPDALFTVGSVEWAHDPEHGAVFALSTLDRLRTRDRRGEVVRDVPAWRLAAPVFTALAALHAQVERRAASRLVIARLPGFELREGEDGPGPVESSGAVYGEAFLLVPPPRSAPGAGACLLAAVRDPDAEPVVDVALEAGGPPPPAVAADPRLPLAVSPAWFGGAAHVEDRAACSC